MKTFKLDFGNGLMCETRTTDTMPEKGKSHILEVQWTGTPKPKHLRKYIAWMNSLNQTLANEWNTKIMHVYQLGTNPQVWEFWVYEPNANPRRVKNPV